MTAEFDYKDLITWQNLDKLGENDATLLVLTQQAMLLGD